MKKTIASIYPSPFDEQIQHDYNSSVFSNGELYCYEEGKITSIKNDGSSTFPEKSLLLGMKELKTRPDLIDLWVLPKPHKANLSKFKIFFCDFLKAFDQKKNKSFKSWFKKKVIFVKHHNLHTYSAIGSSGWQNGIYLNIDGGGDSGDRRHFVWGKFNNGKLYEHGSLKGFNGPASFHAYVTEFCGFRDENGKLSGFSGYGKVIKSLKNKFSEILYIKPDGIIFKRQRYNKTIPDIQKLDVSNYSRCKVFNDKISKTNISKICKGYKPHDIAATAEDFLADILIRFLRIIKKKFKNEKKIIFSGGFFLNVKINNLIEQSKIFEENFFSMAPSDSGLSMGGIFSQKIKLSKKNLSNYGLNPYLGPSFKDNEVLHLLNSYNLKFTKPRNLERDISKEISKKKIVGIFHDRAEFGLRSLGHRSILADPRYLSSKELINQKVKKRDWFMPFAPAILDYKFNEYFSSNLPSLYMQKAEKINKRYKRKVPAAIHVDDSSRVQYVSKKFSPFFWDVIENFKKKLGFP